MKITRRKLRKLLRESLVQDRAKLVDAMNNIKSSLRRDRASGIDTNRPTQYPSSQMISQGLKNSSYYQARRSVKSLWNDLVEIYGSREYWDNHVKKFHIIGYAHKSDLERYLSRLSSKTPDFSTYGYDPSVYKSPVSAANSGHMGPYVLNFDQSMIITMLEMSGGRVTWAGNFDAWTEELGNKKPHHRELYGNSFPKRPGYRNVALLGAYQADEMLIDKEDVLSHGNGVVQEIIMSNIGIENIDAISIIVKRWALEKGRLSEEDLSQEKDRIKSIALKHGIAQVNLIII